MDWKAALAFDDRIRQLGVAMSQQQVHKADTHMKVSFMGLP